MHKKKKRAGAQVQTLWNGLSSLAPQRYLAKR